MNGLFLREGENVEIVDTETGLSQMDQLEDERQFDTTELEPRSPCPSRTGDPRRAEEVRRRPRTAVQALPQDADLCRQRPPHIRATPTSSSTSRARSSAAMPFVQKITGKRRSTAPEDSRVPQPSQRLAVAVTVDLLTTGVDIPDLEFIVFLRPVKSRILFEQMLGRGTRKGEKYPDKDHFTVFDCFDGTLFAYFKNSTGITKEEPAAAHAPIAEIVEDIWANRDRDYNVGCLVKRLQRIDKSMSGEAREMFAAFVPDGDLARSSLADSPRRCARLREHDGLLRTRTSRPCSWLSTARAHVREGHRSDRQRDLHLVFRDVAGNGVQARGLPRSLLASSSARTRPTSRPCAGSARPPPDWSAACPLRASARSSPVAATASPRQAPEGPRGFATRSRWWM
jgi:hypothetical protein